MGVALLAVLAGLLLGVGVTVLVYRRGRDPETELPTGLPGVAFRCELEPQPRLLAVNNGISALLGLEPAVLQRMSASDLLELVHPDDRPALQALGAALASGAQSSGAVQFRFRSVDGRQRLLLNQFAAERRRSTEGAQTFLGLLSDVTLSRDESEARELSGLQLRGLSELLAIEFFELDPRSGSWRLQGSLFASMGYTVGDTPRYSHFLSAVHRDDLALLPATPEGFLTLEGVSEVVFRFLGADRRWHWLRARFGHLDDANTERASIFGLIVDASEEQARLEALSLNEARLRHALDSARLGLVEYLVDSDETFGNARAAQLFGIGESFHAGDDGLLGPMRDVGERWHPEIDEAELKLANHQLREVIEGSRERLQTYYHLPNRNGSSRTLRMTASLAVVGREKVRRIIAVLEDVTRERRAADELAAALDRAQAATTAKSEFLANMSHEIRTPMNAIVGMSQLALKIAADERLKHYLVRINSAADALLGIVNDILDLSKIEAGRLELEQAPFRLSDVLGKVSALASPRAEEKGIEFIINVGEESLPATTFVGDAVRLGQVMVNLVVNAVKFTDAGQVELRVRRLSAVDGQTMLQFEVRDTGIGISAAEQAHIFQPFSQADGSITRRYGGTGLGLVISRDIVTLLGGEIWLESEPGKGSTFYFTARLATAPIAEAERRPRFDLRVMMVDDNNTSRLVLGRQLQRVGCTVDEYLSAEDALIALDNAATPRYDAIITDWRMPGMDGDAFAEAVRARFRDDERPRIAVVSAFNTSAQLEGGVGKFCDAVLAKPVEEAQLLKFLDRVSGNEQTAPIDPETGINALLGLRLLLVEDNPVNQEVATDMLEAAGALVTVADQGEAALALLEAQSFDCVLMDCQMPVMDGIEATRRLRERPELEGLPVLAVSASVLTEDRRRAMDAGMNGFLSKPYTSEALCQAVLALVTPPMVGDGAAPMPSGDTPAAELEAAAVDSEAVDIAAGLQRFGGDPARYWRIARRFRETTADFAQRILAAIDANDLVSAQREAHTLKGTAGMICATCLAYHAGVLELALRDGLTPTDVILHCCDELERVRTELAAAEARSAGSS